MAYDPKRTLAERDAAPSYAEAKFSDPIDQAMQTFQVAFAAKYGADLAESLLDDMTIRELLKGVASMSQNSDRAHILRSLELTVRAAHNTLHVIGRLAKIDDDTLHTAIDEYSEGYTRVMDLALARSQSVPSALPYAPTVN